MESKICIVCGKVFYKKLTTSKKGWLGSKYCSHSCQHIGITKNGKLRGKGHWNWRGGITDEIRLLRHTPQYNNWRFAVYKRDKYHCIYCNKHCHEKDIVAHHIEDFKSNIKLRYDIGNGVTLCRKCHLNLHRNSIQLQVTLF